MGATLRRYWMPALLARELPSRDGAPVRVRLLGEDLVAFRDTQGRMGLLDEFCPHRRASLFFGAQRGLRAALRLPRLEVRRDGRCVDMMNEPAEAQFTDKIAITAYPTLERAA
jgi:phenylpropionate dioxygenase-like ring-hydroxylating dioxygenase large terminal subunit